MNGTRRTQKWAELYRALEEEGMSVYAVAETHLRDEEQPPIHQDWCWTGQSREMIAKVEEYRLVLREDMAFPPHRPPLGMPGMPVPPMLAPPYSMPHMVPGGMIPMAMGVMPPMMAHVAVTVPPSIPILAQPPQQPSPQPRSQGKRGHGSGSGSAVIEKKPLVRRNQQSAVRST
ncbi:hypothetical protein HPB48_013851 [Haemaphysalis longicornis]|uniref:Uncharacterized protein n=1 Tax=Haemaphysalis longicornis TaxID=44386 RepID=A0A9J6GLY6_HAELO|nr:hypothetical protein HPB48_013851 [Haemaphysalis longicornis]